MPRPRLASILALAFVAPAFASTSFVVMPTHSASGVTMERVVRTSTPTAPPATPKPTARPAPKPHVVHIVAGSERPNLNRRDTRPVPRPAVVVPLASKYNGPDIEDFPRYEGQSTCDPTDKPGTVALRNVLLAHYPVTVSFGISRACTIGGKSEHKEGRAFDWGANVANASQRAAVEDFFKTIFATDSYGHPQAIARRMGIMYVIWNKQIRMVRGWGEWQPYEGDSPHTDHVHISMSWAGARAQTSYWSGHVPAELLEVIETPRPRERPEPTYLPPLPTDEGDGHHHHHHPDEPTPTPTATPDEVTPTPSATPDGPAASPTPGTG